MGYEYRATKTDAKRYIKTLENCEAEVERIVIQLTRSGAMRALNRYGGHPDNG